MMMMIMMIIILILASDNNRRQSEWADHSRLARPSRGQQSSAPRHSRSSQGGLLLVVLRGVDAATLGIFISAASTCLPTRPRAHLLWLLLLLLLLAAKSRTRQSAAHHKSHHITPSSGHKFAASACLPI